MWLIASLCTEQRNLCTLVSRINPDLNDQLIRKQYTNSLVNADSFYANFTNTTFQKIPITHFCISKFGLIFCTATMRNKRSFCEERNMFNRLLWTPFDCGSFVLDFLDKWSNEISTLRLTNLYPLKGYDIKSASKCGILEPNWLVLVSNSTSPLKGI